MNPLKTSLFILCPLLLLACRTSPKNPPNLPQSPPYTIEIVSVIPHSESAVRNHRNRLITAKLLDENNASLTRFPIVDLVIGEEKVVDLTEPYTGYIYTVKDKQTIKTEQEVRLGQRVTLRLEQSPPQNNARLFILLERISYEGYQTTLLSNNEEVEEPLIKTRKLNTSYFTGPLDQWTISSSIPKGSYLLSRVTPPSAEAWNAFRKE
jgi:hypothetical protein